MKGSTMRKRAVSLDPSAAFPCGEALQPWEPSDDAIQHACCFVRDAIEERGEQNGHYATRCSQQRSTRTWQVGSRPARERRGEVRGMWLGHE